MLQFIGAMLIIAGCSGLGMFYKGQFQEGYKQIQNMIYILDLFQSEIYYDLSTLSECCKNISSKVKEPYRSAFENIYREYERPDRENFSILWKKNMQQALETLPLKKEEKDVFVEFAVCITQNDNSMLQKAIEQRKEMLTYYLGCRAKALTEKNRICIGLGIMSGILIAIILL